MDGPTGHQLCDGCGAQWQLRTGHQPWQQYVPRPGMPSQGDLETILGAVNAAAASTLLVLPLGATATLRAVLDLTTTGDAYLSQQRGDAVSLSWRCRPAGTAG